MSHTASILDKKHGLLPTPPLPADTPAIDLTDNARQVLTRRYVRRDDNGQPAESVEEMFWRVAYHVAKVEEGDETAILQRAREFYMLLTTRSFFPNSPTFTGAGTPLGQLAACFTADMRVTTEFGVKRIADLQIGDRLLTHQGRYRPVTELFQRNYQGTLLRLQIKLIGVTLEVTPEHPILTPTGWVKASELAVGDRVAIGAPIGVRPAPRFDLAESVYAESLEIQSAEESIRVRRPGSYQNSGRQAVWGKRFIEPTRELARLCGYYVSEGTIGPDERYLRFTFSQDEVTYQQDVTRLLLDIFGLEASSSNSDAGNWMNINIYSRAVAAWFRQYFGTHSYHKRIPVWLQYADPDIQREFLVGLMRGDGLYYEKQHVIKSRKSPKLFRSLRLTLSNPGLIQQIWQMCLRLGYDAAIRPVDTTYVTPNARPTEQISMPPLQSRELVQAAFGYELPEPDPRYIRNTVSRENERVYFEIGGVEAQDYSGIVYNCEVDEDHSYVTEGVVVHNCFVLPISDDMGRDSAGIFQTLRDAALIQQTGGGNGFGFSRLRPKGALVKSSAGEATGPVGFLRVYDKAFGEIAQGGCLLPDTLVFTERGLLRLDEIVDPQIAGWQDHQFSLATDEGPRLSRHGYNNGVAPVLRIHTRHGLSLAGTPDHRVKKMTDAGPQWARLDDLHPGDWLCVRLGEQRGALQALRLPQRQHGNQVWPSLPVVLDEELAFFLGYLAGDGFISGKEDDHRVGVSVAHNSYLMIEMPALLERLFGIRVNLMQKAQDRSCTLVMDNRALKEFLLLNGLEKPRSHDAFVPRLIRRSPPEVVGAYLRGLFEADGSLIHGYPALMTTSPRLAEEVRTLLIGLGCPARVRSTTPGTFHFGKLSVFTVRIESTIGLQAWRERIGCDPRSRFVSAYSWESDQRREIVYTLPNPAYWINPVLDAITLEQVDQRGRGLGQKFRSKAPRLRRALLRYLRGERQLTRSGYDELCAAYPEFAAHAPSAQGWWFVQVNGVEAVGEALTLDLEVDDNHTYLANGVVTHNSRRGANMAVLRIDHPDIEEFITCKTDENQITNFNISVGITDAFMRAVENDELWELRFPDVMAKEYKGFSGTLEQADAAGVPVRVYKTVRARDLFDKIVAQAHHNGEPGMLFLDAANRANPVPHLYQLEATNPCGEQYLGSYENCCLGSVNLAQHFGPNGSVDWEKLRANVALAARFLDDVVTANAYVPAVPQLKEAAHKARRIGLGIMGLGDLMYHAGIRYGSDEGQEFAAQVMEFVRYHAMQTSIEMASERGPFPAIEDSIYDPNFVRWQPPNPLTPYSHDYGRPRLDWDAIVEGIRQHGIRNAAQTTIAPTGTIATVAGCEGYGCEPVFALAYIRHVNDKGKDLQLTYASPLFEKALAAAGLDEAARNAAFAQVMEHGTCQDVLDLPEAVRRVFVVSADISAEEHVRMQAAMQAFVDNSLSKTINFPEGAAEEDVATAYKLAWELGCKGITVYVTGSRHKVVLETKATATAAAKQKAAPAPEPAAPVEQLTIWHEDKKPRPRKLHGYTYNVSTPVGKAFVTINENGGNQPFEVFINTSKAGSETAAVSEAIGRLISYVLRMASPIVPRDRLREVFRQLAGIGGGRSLGFGPNRVRSLPDGVSHALNEYLENSALPSAAHDEAAAGNGHQPASEPAAAHRHPDAIEQGFLRIGDLCPECGEAAVINEEGCRKCYACGYSEC